MRSQLRLAFGRGDIIAIALVALLAIGTAACFAPWKNAEADGVAQIYQDGQLLRELPLDADTSFEIRGDYLNTISVSDGRAFFEDSDCPGRDCVHSGAISSPGRSIACLPNLVEIRISGQGEVDFTVG